MARWGGDSSGKRGAYQAISKPPLRQPARFSLQCPLGNNSGVWKFCCQWWTQLPSHVVIDDMLDSPAASRQFEVTLRVKSDTETLLSPLVWVVYEDYGFGQVPWQTVCGMCSSFDPSRTWDGGGAVACKVLPWWAQRRRNRPFLAAGDHFKGCFWQCVWMGICHHLPRWQAGK